MHCWTYFCLKKDLLFQNLAFTAMAPMDFYGESKPNTGRVPRLAYPKYRHLHRDKKIRGYPISTPQLGWVRVSLSNDAMPNLGIWDLRKEEDEYKIGTSRHKHLLVACDGHGPAGAKDGIRHACAAAWALMQVSDVVVEDNCAGSDVVAEDDGTRGRATIG